MKMKKQLFASIAVASTIGFFTPLTSYAFGLGEIKVMSALNEPFKATIDINSLSTEEKESFEIRIASNDEFEKAGLDRSYILSQLKFDVVEQSGKPRVLITSQLPVKEPFLDFLLTATAGGGKLIREYTVLLDPPEVLMSSQRTTQQAASTSSANNADSSSEVNNVNTVWANGSTYGPVAKADTLWNIALNTRPDESVSVQQMMLALVNANPEAFVDNNINGLKAGYTLSIPDKSAILAKSQAQAYQAFKAQNEAWRQRNTVTNKPAPTPAVIQPSTDESEPAAEDTTDANTIDNTNADNSESSEQIEDDAAEQARLKLVAPEQSKTTEDDASPNLAGNEKINALTEQLTLAQETIEAQAQENIDFKARMDAMEEQLETMRRLISLKDADLARLQDMLEEKEQNNAAGDNTAAEPDLEPLAASDDTAADADTYTENNETADAQLSTEQAQAELSEEPSEELVPANLVDNIKQFLAEYKLQVGGALLVFLLLLLLLARRKNKEDESFTEETIPVGGMSVTDDTQTSLSDYANEASVEEPVTEYESKDEPLNQESLPQKSVMELVEQADMFVGYADYAQAKIALDQAKAREPDNTLVAYKLLFVLYKQKQVDDFIALAESTDFDEESIEWDEIKQWGAQLAPEHPLFQAEDTADTEFVSDESTEPEKTIDDVATDEQLDFKRQDEVDNVSIDVDLSEEDSDDTPLEFSTVNIASDIEQQNHSNAEDTQLEDTLTEEIDNESEDHIEDDLLSFDTGTTFGTHQEEDDNEEENIVEHDSLLPFEPGASSSLDPERVDIAPFDSDLNDEADIEFDIGDIDEIDEAETKLDLASAYIDMDDPEGATSILKEVIAEGNDEQKVRAQTILDSLSD
ncbi:MAG: hypothetical protein CMH22_03730 [Methylophaga sp.]|nr:hypothetical protein [Methylophaga sp.]|tara:strand:+ start:11572 stop:14172 length:2601 start_codon:yes stop_codon:yes gene_type:complete